MPNKDSNPRFFRGILDRVRELGSKYQSEEPLAVRMVLEQAGVKNVAELESMAANESQENMNATGARLETAKAELEDAQAVHDQIQAQRREEEAQERDLSAARAVFDQVRDRIKNELKTLPENVKIVRQDIVQRLCASPWGYSENDRAIINLANALAVAQTKILLLPAALQLIEGQLAETDEKLAALRSKRQ